jgi:hypothetical protein
MVQVITHAVQNDDEAATEKVRDRSPTKKSSIPIRSNGNMSRKNSDESDGKEKWTRSASLAISSRESSLTSETSNSSNGSTPADSSATSGKSGRSLSLTEERIAYSQNLRKAAALAFGKK